MYSSVTPDQSQPFCYKNSDNILGRQSYVLLIKYFSGLKAPTSWKGGFDFTYHIGIKGSTPNVTIEVNAKLRKRNITNVVGTILGEEEPDKWVLLGAHRDSWAFGAVDSSSGTAVIMEIARGLNELLKSGDP